MQNKVVRIPEVYEPLYNQDNWTRIVNYYLLSGGRNSGKTSVITPFMHYIYETHRDNDIIVFIPALRQEKDTLKLQLEGYLKDYDLLDGFRFNAEGFVSKAGYENRIYFYPAQTNAHDQMNVSKGLTTRLPVALILVDELQKMHNKEIVKQFLNTALKKLILHGFCIFAMNEERKALWASAYVREKEADPECIVIKSTYADLIDMEDGQDLLPRAIRDEIEREFIADPILARQIYLNDMDAKGWETVFATFSREKHYRKLDTIPELRYLLKSGGINAVVFGLDFASNKDSTVSLPIFKTTNHKIAIPCGDRDYYYFSPVERNCIIAPSEHNNGIIANIKNTIDKFNIRIGTPIFLVCDCAAAGNIEELKSSIKKELIVMQSDVRNYKFIDLFSRVICVPFTDKTCKSDNLMRVRGLFARDGLIYLLDDGTSAHENKLVVEIESQRYREDGKLNPQIPNDRTDALEYGLLYIFDNPDRQYEFEILANLAQSEQNKLMQA
jgi:hypothetical protein